MAYFLVTYDLVKNKDYKRLIEELKRLDSHRAALSAWFVEISNYNAEMTRAWLSDFVDDDDKLVVVEFERKPATLRAFTGTREWIAQRF